MVLEVECIEYFQLRHRGGDHLQGRERLIACADLVRRNASVDTPRPSTTTETDALFENQGVVGRMTSFISKRGDQIAAE